MGRIKQAPDVAAEVFDSSWSTDAAGQLHSDVQQYLAEKQTQYVSHSEEHIFILIQDVSSLTTK